jgi:hypothetical protein
VGQPPSPDFGASIVASLPPASAPLLSSAGEPVAQASVMGARATMTMKLRKEASRFTA